MTPPIQPEYNADVSLLRISLPAAIGLLFATDLLRADSVTDDRGVFGAVVVYGFSDGKLAFRFADGRVLERPIAVVRSISLDVESDPAADELGRAETLRQHKQFAEAAPIYDRCRGVTTHDWLRDYATFRQIEAYDESGAFSDAVDCYLALSARHPSLVKSHAPRRVPATDSIAARQIRQKLDALAAKQQPASTAEAIERVQGLLDGAAGAGQSQRPASRPAKAPRSAKTATRGKYQPRSLRITAGVYRLMQSGKSQEAWSRIEKGLATASDRDRDVWWLVESEYHLALGEMDKAALAALKVYALCPDSPYVAEALLLAGQGYERIRPGKAESLYELCLKHPTLNDGIRTKVRERLSLLKKTTASAPASRPND